LSNQTIDDLAFKCAKSIERDLQPIIIKESGEIRTYLLGQLKPSGEYDVMRYLRTKKFDLNTPELYHKVVHHLKSGAGAVSLSDLSQPSNLINLKSGMVNIDSFELKKHTRETATLTQFPIEYDPKASCRNFLTFLHEIQPDPKIQYRILKSWALCFDRRCMKRQADLWIGELDTGKTTLARTLLHLLGKDNVSMESLQALGGEDPYSKSQLFQKVANISFDLTQVKIDEAGDLKRILGGDGVRARFIYQKPFDFLPYQKLFAICNVPPYTDEKLYHDLAFWERFRITFFKRQFKPEEKDESLIDEQEPERSKLINPAELSGIFNLLLRILHNVRKSRDYGYTFNGVETRDIWLAQTDYIRKWMNETLVKGEKESVPVTFLRETWNKWRIAHSISDPGVMEFNAHISQLATQTSAKEKVEGEWKSVKVWKGITTQALKAQESGTLDAST
jgi:putative DNA primase/helicase